MQNGIPPLPELPGLNLSQAARMLGGNQALLLRLVSKFPKNHGMSAAEISTAHQNGDRELAYRLAHTLKGVSGTIGAEKVQQCADKVVRGLKSNSDIKENLEEMEIVLQEVLQSIEQLS